MSGIWTHHHWIPFRRSNRPSYQAMSPIRTESQLCTATPISSLFSVFTFHFSYCLRQSPHLLEAKSRTSNHISSGMIDTYGVHHWRTFRSSSRNLAWMGFEPTTTEFHSHALTDWAIRPWVQLALRANFLRLLQFHLFVQWSHFILAIFLRQSPHLLSAKSGTVNHVSSGMIDTHGIHHWRIFRSSYRKLALVGFEPTTTEFRSDALTDWAIRPWVQLALRANFVQLLQFHLFVQCSHFISAIAFVSRHICLKGNLAQVITLAAEWLIHMVFTTEGFLEVAIESRFEWDLNPRPMISVQGL